MINDDNTLKGSLINLRQAWDTFLIDSGIKQKLIAITSKLENLFHETTSK